MLSVDGPERISRGGGLRVNRTHPLKHSHGLYRVSDTNPAMKFVIGIV
jgi:hypothetical protein